MKINVLDSSVYNRISAGEVVENPASVVKELVENAIDAGANCISVSIEDGGIKYISVTDNGAGIEREELPKTILAHATSKIKEADDLSTISTLGFRGEALASIAAVSEVEILTCAIGESCGSLLRSKDGKVEISDAASKVGTSVRVKNLFYNTPARYKFLSSKSTEESYISRYIFQFILANPDISIEYFADGNLVYSSSGDGLSGAVQAVFLPKIYENLIEVAPYSSGANVTISGYVTPPSIFKNNRTQQTIVLNGRIVTDATISATVQNAYGERLMNRCFPIFVLNIVMPFDEVDVNVHPNKREVRFGNPRKVYGAIYHAVKQTLDNYEDSLREEITSNLLGNFNENAKNQAENTSIRGDNLTNNPIDYSPRDMRESFKGNASDFNTSEPKMSLADALNLVRGGVPTFTLNEPSAVTVGEPEGYVVRTVPSRVVDDKPIEKQPETEIEIENSFADIAKGSKSYKVIGQIFDTYLIVESCGKVLFIDQHAMHERILFDEFTEELEKSEISVQPLMLPYIYESSPEVTAAILAAQNVLGECGFEIEEFGRSAVKISGVPSLLGKINLHNLMTEIADGITVGKGVDIASLNRDKLASMACKAAIKGGDPLSHDQIALIMDFFANGKMPLQCPHGRPTAIIYSKYDFEKLFRRKV